MKSILFLLAGVVVAVAIVVYADRTEAQARKGDCMAVSTPRNGHGILYLDDDPEADNEFRQYFTPAGALIAGLRLECHIHSSLADAVWSLEFGE